MKILIIMLYISLGIYFDMLHIAFPMLLLGFLTSFTPYKIRLIRTKLKKKR